MKLKVVIHADTDGGYWAKVPALPGCVTEADTREELMANLREAIEGWLEVAGEDSAFEPGSELAEVDV
jgi:predicted RNase H-like HicB family nuclease